MVDKNVHVVYYCTWRGVIDFFYYERDTDGTPIYMQLVSPIRTTSVKGTKLPKSLKNKMDKNLLDGEFIECDTCRAKPGSPMLCDGCMKNRHTISSLGNRRFLTEIMITRLREFIKREYLRGYINGGAQGEKNYTIDILNAQYKNYSDVNNPHANLIDLLYEK